MKFFYANQKCIPSLYHGLLLPVVALFLLIPFFIPSSEAATALEPVVVVGTVEAELTGNSRLDSDQLEVLPSRDGNVEALLKNLPGVQASDESITSFKGGEIIPPLLSISGGRPYQNNFRIDGIGNNSLLDPAADNPHLIDRLPGHPEELFLNDRLVDNVTVYDHNVPARYGGFTGGVVDVETIKPADQLSGSVHYKTTRDAWTSFHVDPGDQQAFDDSKLQSRQPNFTKHVGGFDFSLPVGVDTGFLFSYQFAYSEIPLVFLDRKQNQSRFNENYLLKLVHEPSRTDTLTLQAIYSPYEGEYFTADTKNGDFVIKGGGASLLGRYETTTSVGDFELVAGIRRSENSREAAKDFFTWQTSPNKDWGSLVGSSTSKEGGFGDLDISQESAEVAVEHRSNELVAGDFIHQLNSGLQWLLTHGKYDRDQASYAYRTPFALAPVDCGTDTTACILFDQFLSKRNVYDVSHSRAEINQYALFIEDLIDYKRLELRPGLRYSYDDLMGNHDLAPRLAGSYDLFGNGRTRIVGGWNRYYGDTLLTYKLREGIALTLTQERTTVVDNDTEWTTTNQTLAQDQFSRLKTPYADELVAGLDQVVFGGDAQFYYVRRDGYDEFARERDPFVGGVVRYARLNNNGRSHYESYRASWDKRWVKQFLSLNVTYQKSTTTHGDYADTLLDDDLNDRVWFAGELLYRDELPREDFNRPWTANLLYSVTLPYGFTFTNVTNYRDGYKGIEDSGNDIDVGGTFYDEYREFNRPSTTIFDWRIDWQPGFVATERLTCTVEVFNVFNKRSHVGSEIDEYELGRQFWLGAEFSF